MGRSAYELVHPDDRAVHARTFVPLVAGEVDRAAAPPLPDRRRRDALGRGPRFLARDAAGRPNGIAGVIEDVTERHRTQQYEAAEQAVIDVLAPAIDVEHGVGAARGAGSHLDWDLAELWSIDPEREVLDCTDAWGERRDRA